MKTEVPQSWAISIVDYLEADPNSVKSVLIDPYGIYVQSYVKDENGLIRFNPEKNEPMTTLHAIPVIPDLDDE